MRPKRETAWTVMFVSGFRLVATAAAAILLTSAALAGSKGSGGKVTPVVKQSFDDIVDHCCYAWNTLLDQPWKIMSIAHRDWASVGYSM